VADGIIDIERYLDGGFDDRGMRVFAVWGGEGEQSRFALPVWRAICLTGGDWGGIVSLPKEGARDASPLFVLDVGQDPARTGRPVVVLGLLKDQAIASLAHTSEGDLAVLLGEDSKRRWFLQVAGGVPEGALEDRERGVLLFLAGECSGLLFFRELATPPPSAASAP